MVRKILGGLCLVMAAGGFTGAATSQGDSVIASIVIAVIFLVAGILLFFKKGKPKEEKVAQKAELKAKKQEIREQADRRFAAEHMAGLPLAESAVCTVSFEDSGISVQSSGNTFNLSYDKVTAMNVKTSVEIQKAYVSSIGGTVAGAALFGPLGAIVGGRAKEKKSKTVENFAIFTYLKDGSIDYLSFKLYGQDQYKVSKLIQKYKPRISQQGAVTEL